VEIASANIDGPPMREGRAVGFILTLFIKLL
jgi:hypothetical protein